MTLRLYGLHALTSPRRRLVRPPLQPFLTRVRTSIPPTPIHLMSGSTHCSSLVVYGASIRLKIEENVGVGIRYIIGLATGGPGGFFQHNYIGVRHLGLRGRVGNGEYEVHVPWAKHADFLIKPFFIS